MLFIDEIHRLNPAVEEILYPAMEDYPARPHHRRGAGGASVKIDLRQVHAGRRHDPRRAPHHALRDRFGIPIRLEFLRGRGTGIDRARAARASSASRMTGRRPRDRQALAGTPRIAGRLLRRVRDFAAVAARAVDARRWPTGRSAARCRRSRASTRSTTLSHLIADQFGGGPVGIETIAAALSEPRDAIEEIVEPTCSSRASSRAPRAGACSPPQPSRHLGLARRRAPAAQ